MDTVKNFLDTVPEEMKKEMFDVLKSWYEPKTGTKPTVEELDLILEKIRK